MGMHADSSAIRMKTPVSPISSTTSVAKLTSGSVREARTNTTGEGSGRTLPAMPVPLFDTQSPLRPLRGDVMAAIERVVDGGRFVLGPEVAAFERELAGWLGAPHAVGVANGTEAITIALRALGAGPGDEVVVPSFTFYASAEAIPPTGATPVFCDV